MKVASEEIIRKATITRDYIDVQNVNESIMKYFCPISKDQGERLNILQPLASYLALPKNRFKPVLESLLATFNRYNPILIISIV
jgi:hypothetical protein